MLPRVGFSPSLFPSRQDCLGENLAAGQAPPADDVGHGMDLNVVVHETLCQIFEKIFWLRQPGLGNHVLPGVDGATGSEFPDAIGPETLGDYIRSVMGLDHRQRNVDVAFSQLIAELRRNPSGSALSTAQVGVLFMLYALCQMHDSPYQLHATDDAFTAFVAHYGGLAQAETAVQLRVAGAHFETRQDYRGAMELVLPGIDMSPIRMLFLMGEAYPSGASVSMPHSCGMPSSGVPETDHGMECSMPWDKARNITHFVRPGCDLSDMDLSGCRFLGSDLSKARLVHAKLVDVRFVSCSLEQADLTGADLTRAEFVSTCLDGARLDNALLSDANFRKASIRSASMANADLLRTDLTLAALSGTKLSGARLTATVCAHANFEGCDLSQAQLTEVDLTHCNLTDTSLRGATIDSSCFAHANLQRADLRDIRDQRGDPPDPLACDFLIGGAWLDRTGRHFLRPHSLVGTRVENACFSELQLDGKDLTGARIKNSVLLETALCGAQLQCADLKGTTITLPRATLVQLETRDYATALGESFSSRGGGSLLTSIDSIDDRFIQLKIDLMRSVLRPLTSRTSKIRRLPDDVIRHLKDVLFSNPVYCKHFELKSVIHGLADHELLRGNSEYLLSDMSETKLRLLLGYVKENWQSNFGMRNCSLGINQLIYLASRESAPPGLRSDAWAIQEQMLRNMPAKLTQILSDHKLLDCRGNIEHFYITHADSSTGLVISRRYFYANILCLGDADEAPDWFDFFCVQFGMEGGLEPSVRRPHVKPQHAFRGFPLLQSAYSGRNGANAWLGFMELYRLDEECLNALARAFRQPLRGAGIGAINAAQAKRMDSALRAFVVRSTSEADETSPGEGTDISLVPGHSGNLFDYFNGAQSKTKRLETRFRKAVYIYTLAALFTDISSCGVFAKGVVPPRGLLRYAAALVNDAAAIGVGRDPEIGRSLCESARGVLLGTRDASALSVQIKERLAEWAKERTYVRRIFVAAYPLPWGGL